MINISPEELLKNKETAGGLVYDTPDEKIENISPTYIDDIPTGVHTQINEIEDTLSVKPESVSDKEEMDSKINLETSIIIPGWKNVPLSRIPSEGIFYEDGTKIAIRAAELREIKHYSTIDENDDLDIEEKLNYIIDSCLRINFPSKGNGTMLDLKGEDRFFLIMAIRDLTFMRGENMIILKPKKKCTNKQCSANECLIELRSGNLSSHIIDENIMKHYNSDIRGFSFNIKKVNKTVNMFIPTLGINKIISNFIDFMHKKNIELDEQFIKIAPFLYSDWRKLNNDTLFNDMKDFDNISKEEFSLLLNLSDKIKVGTTTTAKQTCGTCGETEVTADITFPSGLRSLFVISDIFGELLDS